MANNIEDISNLNMLPLFQRNYLVYQSILAGNRPRLIGYHFSKSQISDLTQAIEKLTQNESNPSTIKEMKDYIETIKRRSN
jgi:hypothetical protein